MFAYRVWQLAWGFPQTLAGACLLAANARKPRFSHHGAIVTVWNLNAGLSLGPFVFLNAWAGSADSLAASEAFQVAGEAPRYVEYLPNVVIDDRLLVHEYGHTIQSLVLGPLFLPVIGLPSIIWFKTPRLARRRRQTGRSYYSFYTERWANRLGERVLKRPSMGQALID